MAAKKKAPRKSPAPKTPRTAEVYSERNQPEGKPWSFSDFFLFTESYTSLILGLVVVIIASVLLMSFFKNRHIASFTSKQDISSATSTVNKDLVLTLTPSPTAALVAQKPSDTPTSAPTSTPTSTPKPTPTVTKAPTHTPTKAPTATPVPAKKSTSTPVPSKAQPQTTTKPGTQKTPGHYTVQTGDSLWKIAEKVYGDGYKWVDIARANNLSNPNVIYSNLKLTLPQEQLANQPSQQQGQGPTQQIAGGKITGTTYTVVHGDDLWNIAVRAYGNGYRWVEIAKANNLTDPGVIHKDNVLRIPR